jgi:hypothetical protein
MDVINTNRYRIKADKYPLSPGFSLKFFFFFISWYRHSSLFQLHIIIPFFPRSASVSAPFGLYCIICLCLLSPVILSTWFIHPCLCSSVLFCTDYFFKYFMICPVLIRHSLLQPLIVLKYPISISFMSLALIVQDLLSYRKDGTATNL